MSSERSTTTKPPFFIVAASRSGTTMLRLMLNAHSRIAIPHEMKYFGMSVPQRLLERWQNPELDRPEFEHIIDRWLQKRKHAFEEVGFEEVRSVALDTETDFRAPFQVAMEIWAMHYGKRIWGEKTPANLFYADIIADMFPEGRFIYLARDPRAVVRSMSSIEFFSDDTAINAYNWKEAATRGLSLLTESVPPERRLIVYYERLVKQPEASLRQICAFLGEEFESDMLDFHKSPRQMLPETVRTPNIQRPVDEAAAEKWRRELSPEEIALVEAICREPMKQLGYEPTDNGLGMKALLNLAIKSAYWKWKRYRQREKRDFTIKYTPFARFRSSKAAS